MRRSSFLLVLMALLTSGACHPKPKPDAPADAGMAVVKTAVSAAPSAAPAVPNVRATSAQPVLAARLDGDRVAVLLEASDAVHKDPPGTLAVYARKGILTVGAPVDAGTLSAEAKKHLDSGYQIHGDAGEACTGTLEGTAIVHRLPEDDPTAGGEPGESDADLAKRIYRVGDKEAVIAIVHATGCKGVLWASPKWGPPPTDVAVRMAPKNTSKKLAPVLQMDDAFQSFQAGGKPDALTYTALGDHRVWVWAKASSSQTCWLVSTEGRTAKILGSAGSCPDTVRAATQEGARMYVWFDHARAIVEDGQGPDITWFPTASFAASGGGL